MRLWHKDMIPVLPRQQLISQWRECCCIAKSIAKKGTPNHILVNKIMDYPPNHFFHYTELVLDEMNKRGYKYSFKSINNFLLNLDKIGANYHASVKYEDMFKDWHNDRYFIQCFFNLEEKYICGGISKEEWEVINHYFYQKTKGKNLL